MINSTVEEAQEKTADFFERVNCKNNSARTISKPVCDEYISEYKKCMDLERTKYERDSDTEVSLAEQYIYKNVDT